MTTKLGRKLTDGLTARLEFDYSCNRGYSFGEYYLHGVVNEIISANIDPSEVRVHAGYAHPALSNTTTPRGRHREVDFYVNSRISSHPIACTEVKWANSSYASVRNIFQDLLRLALVNQSEPSSECLFILAGGNTTVKSLLRKPPLAASSEAGRRLLEQPRPDRSPRKRAFPLVVGGQYIETVKDENEQLGVLPETIYTTLVTPAALETKRWTALVWRVGV